MPLPQRGLLSPGTLVRVQERNRREQKLSRTRKKETVSNMAEQHAAANARASGDIHNHFHNLQASNVGVIGGTQHVAKSRVRASRAADGNRCW